MNIKLLALHIIKRLPSNVPVYSSEAHLRGDVARITTFNLWTIKLGAFMQLTTLITRLKSL